MLLGGWHIWSMGLLLMNVANGIDIVDYEEPTMLIVGSRGVGHLKG
jgi:hypothetical protein